jgi:hypothetical protein
MRFPSSHLLLVLLLVVVLLLLLHLSPHLNSLLHHQGGQGKHR